MLGDVGVACATLRSLMLGGEAVRSFYTEITNRRIAIMSQIRLNGTDDKTRQSTIVWTLTDNGVRD